MWVRLRLDFGWWDLAFGATQLCQLQQRPALNESIEKRWCPDRNCIVTLSVRSGFDLLLGTMRWRAGDEIVYSALNIPGMSMIAREHGLVPVPVDLDLEHLAPSLDLLEQAITSRTRAIVIAHLYGNFVRLEPIIAIARRHNLMVIEDCAENYDGVYTGHPDADASLFSFGPLKTATALAGGVLRVKDADLCRRLQANHERWPIQGRRDFFNRLCKYGSMKFFGAKWIYADVRRAVKAAIGDVDKFIHHTAKSFLEDMSKLRLRPCGPLLATMAHRIANFDHERIRQRTANGRYLTDLLRDHVLCPGADADRHNYWLFPILVNDPPKTMLALEAAGFDASQVQSMRAVETPPDRPDLEPINTLDALERMILLPCYPEIPQSELRRMAEVVVRVEKESSLVSALKVTLRPEETRYGRQKTEGAVQPEHHGNFVDVAN